MNTTHSTSLKNKINRQRISDNIINFEKAIAEQLSERAASKTTNIPRTTARYHQQRQKEIKLDDVVLAFFQTPEGLEFLHRLALAAEFSFTQIGGCGLRVIQTFYNLSKLDCLISSSLGGLQKRIKTLENNIVSFSQQQKTNLGNKMPRKNITCCMDETFPSGICLVGIAAVSNFIFLEEMANKRDSDTWSEAMNKGLSGLPVTITQVTSDEASALLKYAGTCEQAHHSPDLFHIQQDLTKGTSAPMRAKIKQAKKAFDLSALRVNRLELQSKTTNDNAQLSNKESDGHASLVLEAIAEKERSNQTLQAAEKRLDAVRETKKSLGEIYHPFDLKSGKENLPTDLFSQLNNAYDVIESNSSEAGLSDNSTKLIKKSRRMIGSMVETLNFFWVTVLNHVEVLGLSKHFQATFINVLLPAAYIEIHAMKAKLAESKHERLESSKALYNRLEEYVYWKSLTENEQIALKNKAIECAHIFQRSSSNVEGRNGQLSLHHHVYKKWTHGR
jgi:hypothetical protein